MPSLAHGHSLSKNVDPQYSRLFPVFQVAPLSPNNLLFPIYPLFWLRLFGRICLFACLDYFCPNRAFFTQFETSPLPVKVYTILTNSRHPWTLSNVPHLLRQGPTLCNGHLRKPVTLTSVAERLAVELSQLFSRLRSVPTGNRR